LNTVLAALLVLFLELLSQDGSTVDVLTKFITKQNKAGVEIPVLWLCYSPKLDAAYCEPCWLFVNRSDPA
jgi:hypothetical protein